MENYEQKSRYIKINDVSHLNNSNALLNIQTAKNQERPRKVLALKNVNRKIVYLSMGERIYKMGDVEAMIGESIVEDTPPFVDRVIDKLNPFL